jgi:CubicO group peptidase (beta-lactamase class C family)
VDQNAVRAAFEKVKAEVDAGRLPGVAVVILYRGETILNEQYGWAMLTPERVPLPPAAIFDLASVTKVVATTPAVMRLMEQGKVALDAPVADYLPEFEAAGKAAVTVRHLLTHTSGLPWWKPFYRSCSTREAVWQAVCDTPLESEPGSQCVYSDLEFLTLGVLVERLSGLRLDEFCRREFFGPQGLIDTDYCPPPEKWARCAATEQCPWRGRVMRGEVHDENAYACGGVAGHAGLFGPAPELARWFGSLLAAHPVCGPAFQTGPPLLQTDTVATMLARQPGPAWDSFALGWRWLDYRNGEVAASPQAFGHSGFTGTLLWADPCRDLAVVFLSNRVHPSRDNPCLNEVRPAFLRSVIRAAG